MRDYSEKRSFPRVSLDCIARYRVQGSDQVARARVRDLSGGGLSMRVEQALAPGTGLYIEIEPGRQITPPLQALVEVLRCAPSEDAAGYDLACGIREMLQQDQVGDEFP